MFLLDHLVYRGIKNGTAPFMAAADYHIRTLNLCRITGLHTYFSSRASAVEHWSCINNFIIIITIIHLMKLTLAKIFFLLKTDEPVLAHSHAK